MGLLFILKMFNKMKLSEDDKLKVFKLYNYNKNCNEQDIINMLNYKQQTTQLDFMLNEINAANISIDILNKQRTKINRTPIDDIFSIKDFNEIQKQIAPKARYKYVYILLDTDNAAKVFNEKTKFQWNVIRNRLVDKNSINILHDNFNLIGMRIYPITADLIQSPTHTFSEFSPSIYTSSSGVEPIYNNDFANLNNAFTILIDEFSSQANIGRDGRRFHFILAPELQNPKSIANEVSWTPINPYYEFVTNSKGDGWFWFNNPITEFSTLTISLANPFKVLPIGEVQRTLIPIMMIFSDTEEEH